MNRPITIVHYWAGCPGSANSKWQRFLALIGQCARRGWRNYLVLSAMPQDRSLSDPFVEAGCEIVIHPRSARTLDLADAWAIAKLLKSLNCDILHCHNHHTTPLLGGALARVPVRIWSKLSMSSWYEKGISPRGLHRLMPSTRLSCMLAHRVLAISDEVGRELVGNTGCRDRVRTVRIPVDLQKYANASRGMIRRELGLDSSHIVITSVAHAVPVKGWDLAIEAFARLHDRAPDARLLLVGEKTSAAFYYELVSMIDRLKMAPLVKLLGKRQDIPRILKSSDIFLLPSRSDGLCCALIEATATPLACVAAAVGGVPEVITDGRTGLLFERENIDQLVEALAKLVADSELRGQLASNAQKASERFAMQDYVNKIMGHYDDLLAAGAGRTNATASGHAMVEGNKNAFDADDVVTLYTGMTELQRPERTILNDIGEDLKGLRMLDIGVGAGRTTGPFSQAVGSYVGIDFAPNMIESCRSRIASFGPNVSFHVCNATDMSMFADDSFDFVLFSFNGIDYLPDEDRRAALLEIRRVLTDGGTFCFSTHNIQALVARELPALTANPAKMLVRIGRYFRSLRKKKRFKKIARGRDRIIINDGAHESRVNTYYISPAECLRELTDCGFGDFRIYSHTSGREITNTTRLHRLRDAWLYYLCTSTKTSAPDRPQPPSKIISVPATGSAERESREQHA